LWRRLGIVPGGSSVPVIPKDVSAEVPCVHAIVALVYQYTHFPSSMDYDSVMDTPTLEPVLSLSWTKAPTLFIAQFYKHESCGRFMPYREGTRMINVTNRKVDDRGMSARLICYSN